MKTHVNTIHTGLDADNIIDSFIKNNAFYFRSRKDEVLKLANSLINLYKGSDDNYSQQLSGISIIKKDFRDSEFPKNLTRTRIHLSTLKKDDLLEILITTTENLDQFTYSLKNEGHKIVDLSRINDYWRITIRKGADYIMS